MSGHCPTQFLLSTVIHKVAGIQELVEGYGVCLLYLPAYSSDLNPIELGFSSIKVWLCANRTCVSVEFETEDGGCHKTTVRGLTQLEPSLG